MKSDSVLARLAASWGVGASQSPDVAKLQAEFAEVSSALESTVELLKTVEAERDSVQEKLASMEVALAEAQSKIAQAESNAAAQKVKTREEKLTALLGTEKAPAVIAATSTLPDADFEAVLSAMEASSKAESKSKMFSEAGAAAEASASVPVDTPSQEMQILVSKYASKK